MRKFKCSECQQLARIMKVEKGKSRIQIQFPESKSHCLYCSPCPDSAISMPWGETEIAARSSA